MVDLIDLHKYVGETARAVGWQPYHTLAGVLETATMTTALQNLLTAERIVSLGAAGTNYTVINPPGLIVLGNAGANSLVGGSGNDQLYGLGGNDTISAGGGVNILDGGDGDDVLYGDDGANTLFGGAGSDTLSAAVGTNNNVFIGGSGNDTMTGAYYSDTYVVDNAADVLTELAGEGID